MRSRGRRQSSSFGDSGERRSGKSRSGRFRGLGFGTIILLVALFFALRACEIAPLDMLAGVS